MCFLQMLQEVGGVCVCVSVCIAHCATKTTRWQGRWCIRSPAAQSHICHRGRNSSNCLRSRLFCLHIAFFLEIKKKNGENWKDQIKEKGLLIPQFPAEEIQIGFYLCSRLNLAKFEHLNLIRGVMINLIRRKDSHTCLTSSQSTRTS